MTKATIHFTTVQLPEKFFRLQGYTERQVQKTTYFKWQEEDVI